MDHNLDQNRLIVENQFNKVISIASKDYSVPGDDTKNLLIPKIIKICLLCMSMIYMNICFGLVHCKCMGRTSNKSGFKSRYHSHED